jgi:hypothetical protein
MSYRPLCFLLKFKLLQFKLPKFKLLGFVLTSILASCLMLVGCGAYLSATPHATVANGASSTMPRSLAETVLSGLGVAQRYDLYLGNSVDISVPVPNAKRDRFMAWLHQIMVQHAGWSTVQEQYVKALTAKFSPAELSELAAIAKQPVMQKLIQSESQTYTETADRRRKLLFQVWNDYNEAKFNPPPEVLEELNQPVKPTPKK